MGLGENTCAVQFHEQIDFVSSSIQSPERAIEIESVRDGQG